MHRHTLTWLAIFGIIVLMFMRLPPMVAKEDSVLNTYRALVEVDALAKQQFVHPIDDDRLVDGAIRGMMFQLDPYSGYIAPDELLRFERRHAGDYIGVGIEVGMPDDQPTVIAAIEGGPAAKAGVLAGDRILAIDGHDVEDLSVFDLERMLEGERGSVVRLTLQHTGAVEPELLTIERGPVSMISVRGFRRDSAGEWDYLIDPDGRIGYIRVSNFRNNTMREFDEAMQKLAETGLRGLIIDLRFNPGGMLERAVEMVDRFVGRGVIVSTVTRLKATWQFSATPRNTLADMQLAVLVNRGSASASEIVSGSLQDHDRGVIVGKRSFGKGSVQRVIHLKSHDAAIKLTVAYYQLPSGRIVHRTIWNRDTDEWGVRPDIEVTLTDEEIKAIQDSRRKLDSGLGATEHLDGGASQALSTTQAVPISPLEIVRDQQLTAALAHLEEKLTQR
ncbi:MAG: S41 family peptidase [Phycisphaerales bacterium]|nr:MAG: S41 family peptidase [Phycisphaerales bacterium]